MSPGQVAFEAAAKFEGYSWRWDSLSLEHQRKWEEIAGAVLGDHLLPILDCGGGILIRKDSIQSLEPGVMLTLDEHGAESKVNGCVLKLTGGHQVPALKSPEEVARLLGWR